MTIKNVTPLDIDKIFTLYNIASNYQREKKTVIVWPDFNSAMVEVEIAENRQEERTRRKLAESRQKERHEDAY